MLKGLGGRFRLFSLGGIIASGRPNPYGLVGSFVSELIVAMCGPGDAMDDFDIFSRVSLPEISVELRTIAVFCPGRLGSLEDCST